MSGSAFLDDPAQLARALEPYCRRYLSCVQTLPGQVGTFRFAGHRGELELASKSRYQAVGELCETDPLRGCLLRWVHRLTEMRVNQLWLDEEERLHRQVDHLVREPLETKLSLFEMKRRALAEPERESLAWWINIDRAGRALSAHRAEYLHRCSEVHLRLGGRRLLDDWSPSESSTSLDGFLNQSWRELADLLAECEIGHFPGLVAAGMGAGHEEGWPARLAPDTLKRLFFAPELFRGVDLKLGSLPERLAPASFLRAAYRVGRALSLLHTPGDRPFAFLRDPDDFFGHRLGYLFVFWSLSAEFDERTLGLSRSQARSRRRSAARILLALVTVSALRGTQYECALDHRAQDGELEDLVRSRLPLTEPMPSASGLSMLNVRRDEGARLFALFDAARTYELYVQDFDSDWWRNPRALERLRADYSAIGPTRVSDENLQLGMSWIFTQIRQGLG